MLHATVGDWKLNGTLPDEVLEVLPEYNETCVAYNKNYDKNAVLGSSYRMMNTTVNTTYLKQSDVSDGQVIMAAVRATVNDAAYTGFPCAGSSKFVCVAQSYSLTKAKLKIEMCSTTGDYEGLTTSDTSSYSTDNWYTLSFTAVGTALSCALVDEATGEVMIDISYDASGIAGGVETSGEGEIGVYSDSEFFKSFKHEDLSYKYGFE